MVESIELLRVLNRHHILYVLNDADHGAIAAVVATDGTNLRIADVMTHGAIAHVMLQPHNSLAKRVDALRVLPQQMQRQA